MNLKRAIWMAVLVYIASFVFAILMASVLGLDLASAVDAPISSWLVAIVGTLIIISLFTLWYFKKVKANAKEGFYFALAVIVIGFILDTAIFVPYTIMLGTLDQIIAYYKNPLSWLTLVSILATGSLVGWMKEKKILFK